MIEVLWALSLSFFNAMSLFVLQSSADFKAWVLAPNRLFFLLLLSFFAKKSSKLESAILADGFTKFDCKICWTLNVFSAQQRYSAIMAGLP